MFVTLYNISGAIVCNFSFASGTYNFKPIVLIRRIFVRNSAAAILLQVLILASTLRYVLSNIYIVISRLIVKALTNLNIYFDAWQF